jgi:hypothetical protein
MLTNFCATWVKRGVPCIQITAFGPIAVNIGIGAGPEGNISLTVCAPADIFAGSQHK